VSEPTTDFVSYVFARDRASRGTFEVVTAKWAPLTPLGVLVAERLRALADVLQESTALAVAARSAYRNRQE
jgi:hypothetical protein